MKIINICKWYCLRLIILLIAFSSVVSVSYSETKQFLVRFDSKEEFQKAALSRRSLSATYGEFVAEAYSSDPRFLDAVERGLQTVTKVLKDNRDFTYIIPTLAFAKDTGIKSLLIFVLEGEYTYDMKLALEKKDYEGWPDSKLDEQIVNIMVGAMIKSIAPRIRYLHKHAFKDKPYHNGTWEAIISRKKKNQIYMEERLAQAVESKKSTERELKLFYNLLEEAKAKGLTNWVKLHERRIKRYENDLEDASAIIEELPDQVNWVASLERARNNWIYGRYVLNEIEKYNAVSYSTDEFLDILYLVSEIYNSGPILERKQTVVNEDVLKRMALLDYESVVKAYNQKYAE